MQTSKFCVSPSNMMLNTMKLAILGFVSSATLLSAHAQTETPEPPKANAHTLVIPQFIDRASHLTKPHIFTGGWEYFVGGGAAAFDCNDDGFADLFASGGENAGILYVNQTKTRGAEISFKAAPDFEPLDATTGAYALDINADGKLDLAILRLGTNMLLEGKGNCLFEDATAKWGLQTSDRWTTAFSATFEKNQTAPTMAFGNYVDRANPKGPFEACDVHELYRPDQDGTYSTPILLHPGFCTLSILFTDWGRKGRQDLMISNDRHYYVRAGAEQLWAMEQTPRLYDESDGWANLSIWGMGIASRDITQDGIPDLYLTSMGDQKLRYFDGPAESDKKPTYRDASFSKGATAHMPYVGDDGRPSSGWHAEFADFNNDGLDDLFVAKGNVDQMPGNALSDPNNLLLQSNEGNFVEVGDQADIANPARSRGAAIADFNRDGKLDIVVMSRRAPMQILENITTPNSGQTTNFVALQLQNEGPNIAALGAWIELDDGERIHAREITIGGGHAGGTTGAQHFGIGHATAVKMRVKWPNTDQWSAWSEIEANQFLTVKPDSKDLTIAIDQR